MVAAFGCGVGDARFQECQDLGPPGVDGAGDALDFGDVGAGSSAPGVETVQTVGDVVALPTGAGRGKQGP